jgi:hypothetical protein
VENRGRGHPRGSKNKVKATTAASSSTVLGKHRHGRPLGSKNKKPSTVAVGASIAPDLDSTQPILPERSPEKLFCFIAFVDAQCHERQRLPLKFAEFMDVREISHTILREDSSGGRHTSCKCIMMVTTMFILLAAGRSLP